MLLRKNNEILEITSKIPTDISAMILMWKKNIIGLIHI